MWRDEVYPTQCALLNNTVCVVGWGGQKSGDMLYIASTDLESWTRTPFPFAGVALATYKSVLVIIGGHSPLYREVTNDLWTSATGYDWQPSLPPMPTKRYDVSAISAGSPDHLVVAGGVDFHSRELNVVEVLVEGLWLTVDPLPNPCRKLRSTYHNMNVYFCEKEGHAYSCKIHSLQVVTCALFSNNTPISSSLWKQSRVHHNTIPVSFGRRLVTMDPHFTTCAYSSVSHSWVEATSVGDAPNKLSCNCYVALTLSPTGELVVVHNEAAYKVELLGRLKIITIAAVFQYFFPLQKRSA